MLTRSDLHSLGVVRRRLLLARLDQGIGSDGRKFKRRKDGSPSMLKVTGRLRGSFVVQATDTRVTVAPTVNYAPYVERARPFIAPTEQEQEEVDREFERLLAIRERELDKRRKRR